MSDRRDATISRWSEAIVALSVTGTLEAAKQIDTIRERADEICIAAESHLRSLIKGLPALRLTDKSPTWFNEMMAECGATNVDARVVSSARHLVRATIAATGDDVDASYELASNGTIEITWDTPRRLTWVIGRPRMSWPGVNLKAYARLDEDRPALECRSFFLAHRAIEHAANHILSSSAHMLSK